MFTHPALKSLLTSLTTQKQDMGGLLFSQIFLGTVERVRKERANDSTSVPASLVSQAGAGAVPAPHDSSLNANNES